MGDAGWRDAEASGETQDGARASAPEAGATAREAPWEAVLGRMAQNHRLLHARTGAGGALDLGFLVRLRRPEDAPALADALGRTPGVEAVALYFDEERPL